jgi:hypothetical protein
MKSDSEEIDIEEERLPDSVEVLEELNKLPAYREFLRERNDESLTYGDT